MITVLPGPLHLASQYIGDAREFVAFEKLGYMKAALGFFVESKGGRTETRVLTTDPASRQRFEYYWKVIRPGSGAIRRSWLRAAKRRAERSPPGSRSRGG